MNHRRRKAIVAVIVLAAALGGILAYARWGRTRTIASDEEMIKKALYKKNNWEENMALTMSTRANDGKYASGAINGEYGGGLWFAQKVKGEWKIVADGNGIPSCESIAEYPDFPNSLLKACFDTKTSELKNR